MKTDRPETPFDNSPFADAKGRPRLFVNGVWLQPRPIEAKDADGCGCLIAVIVAAVVILAAILGSGCTPRYTVIPADREVVPIRQTAPEASTARRTFIEDPASATGWFVPDSVMLDLLEAD